MCVDHLKRCKTSTYRCHVFVFCMVTLQAMKVFLRVAKSNSVKQGALGPTSKPEPTKTLEVGRENVPAFFHLPKWRPAKPRPACQVFRLFQFFKPTFHLMSVQLLQSELLLTSSDGTVASSKVVERILLYCFSRLVIHHCLSGLTEVFLHGRCIPHP